MALIKCEECGAEISDKAESCPHCGYKKQVEQPKTAQQPAQPANNQYAASPNQNQFQGQYQNPYYNPNQQPPYYGQNSQSQYQYNNNGSARDRRYEKDGSVNVFGIIGFVLSIVSLFLALWGVVAITGLVFSVIGMIYGKQMKEKKTSLALSGIIINSYSILYTVGQLLALF